MADSQRKTANLVNISTYTVSGGQSSKYKYFTNVILSAGTYTFSCRQNNTLSSATRNTLFVVINSNLTYESTVADYHLNVGLHSLTFTLESRQTIMLGYWTNALSNDCVYDKFMFNAGSTALPYEPYGWVHSLRKLTTATDTITTLPIDLYADGQNISAYSIKGNMTQNEVCGDKTANLFDGELKQGSVAESSSIGSSYEVVTDYQSTKRVVSKNPVVCHGAKVTWNSSLYWICICYFDKDLRYIGNNSQGFETWLTTGEHEMHKYPYAAIAVRRTDNVDFTPQDASNLNLVVEDYQITISLSQNTYNIYITEPLRKSLDGSNLYDTIESNGTLTRRVDENGDALATPTTEQVTVPTLTTTGTAEQFDVTTTMKPSEVSLTYHGWHEHSDTKF